MEKRGLLVRWLISPPLRGWWALLCAIAAVALPTLARLALDGRVTGLAFSIYIPFGLCAALLLEPWLAAVAGVASAIVADLLFIPPRFSLVMTMPALVGMAILLFCLAVAVILVWEVRREFAANRKSLRRGEPWRGIVFSSLGGQALASWYEGPSHVPLGPEQEVAEMMEDFLAQVELGKRLTGDPPVSEN